MLIVKRICIHLYSLAEINSSASASLFAGQRSDARSLRNFCGGSELGTSIDVARLDHQSGGAGAT